MARKKTGQPSALTENIVKAVIAKYLADVKKVKARPTRGAGPDFIFDGKIVETKGSESDFDRAVTQMLEYASKYASLAFGLPVGFFTAQRVMQLNTLAKIILKKYKKSLTILCVITEQPPYGYRVCELYADSLAYNVVQTIGDMSEWVYPDVPGRTKNYEANMIREIDTLVGAAILRLTKYSHGSSAITISASDSANPPS